MPAPSSRLIRGLPAALVVLVLIGGLAWPLVRIQLRLSRNGEIAARLVEALRARFPGADIRGAASYEREIVYIRVVGGVGPACRLDIEEWLRMRKAERGIGPAIWLRVPSGTSGEEETIVI